MNIDVIGSQKRIEILKELSQGDKYTSQLMENLQMDGRNAKHHLDTLEEEGVIENYYDGRRKYYKLKKEIRLKITPPPEGKFVLVSSDLKSKK